MTKRSISSLIAATIAGAFLLGSNTLQTSLAAESTRIKIATASHSENGCSESTKSFKVFIPKAEQLDHNYQGVVGGIERVYGEANGTRADSNYAFTDQGSSLTFSLFAKGGGTKFVQKGSGTKFVQKGSGTKFVEKGVGTKFVQKGSGTKFVQKGGIPKSAQNGGSKKFKQNGKGSWCQGANGASINVDIYAHYKRNQR